MSKPQIAEFHNDEAGYDGWLRLHSSHDYMPSGEDQPAQAYALGGYHLQRPGRQKPCYGHYWRHQQVHRAPTPA